MAFKKTRAGRFDKKWSFFVDFALFILRTIDRQLRYSMLKNSDF
jgi:hypothetical protein